MHIAEIWTYPVKSCIGISQDVAPIDEYGLVGDREFVVVGGDGAPLTQRNAAKLNLVRIAQEKDMLILDAPNTSQCVVDLTMDGEQSAVMLHDGMAPGRCMGLQTAAWLSEYLGKSCRLIRSDRLFSRNMPAPVAHLFLPNQKRYPDCAPVHFISRESLEALNARSETEIEMSRFRPNFVIEGGDAFCEDSILRMRIGQVEFTFMGVAERCAIPAIVPGSTHRGAEPLRSLRQFRMLEQKFYTGVAFGSYFKPMNSGHIQCGDRIECLEMGVPPTMATS